MSEQTVSFIKGRHGDIAVHDWEMTSRAIWRC